MRTSTHWVRALGLAVLLATAGTATAGDAVRLSVEPPKDVATIEAGDPGIDIQIVGIDSTGARVGFGDKTVEVSATEGDLTLVAGPYKYRYVPPATVNDSLPVKLSAWFKQTPDVRGEVGLVVVPHRPYEKLIIVAPATSVQLGGTIDVEIRGVMADGTSTTIKGQRLVVTSEGAGSVGGVGGNFYRYTAPAKTETKSIGTSATIKASLERYPYVKGWLSILITGEAPPTAPGGGGRTPPPPGTGGGQNPPPTQPPTPTQPPPGGKQIGENGVLWPSGNVKLIVWRTKDTKEEDWSKKEHDMPAPGKTLIAKSPFHKLRIQIERDDVRKIALEWFIGDKKGAAIHIDDGDKEGRLTLEKSKNGKTHALIECETPEDKPLILNLLLTTAKGEILKEEFILQRGADKNDDGVKDKGGKK